MRRGSAASALVALALAVLAGCAGPEAPAPAPSVSAPAPTTPPEEAVSTEPACRPPFPPQNPSGAPYTGPGPHLVEVAVATPDGVEAADPFLPLEWRAPYEGGRQVRERVQLLVCVSVELWREQPPSMVVCHYDFGGDLRLQVYGSTYRATVREAATGALVGEFELPGDRSDRASCPPSIDYVVGKEPDLARGLGQPALADALRPFIEAAR